MAGIASEALRKALRDIRAYHGSPHNFDRFSLEHIGRGEGAQAYGHGLYFAENEAVARGYRDQISKDVFAVGDGGRIWNPSTLEHLNVRVRASRGDIDAAIESAKSVIGSPTMPEATRAMAQRDLAVLEGIRAEGGIRPHTGHMYEVNIGAEPEQFLDWDAPLRRQSPEVRGALEKLGVQTDRGGQYSVHPTGSGKFTVRNVWGEAVGTFKSEQAALARAQAGTDSFGKGGGMLAYTELGGNSAYPHLDRGDVSAQLRDVGVAGIRYLDQGSRVAGEGSRNYVVFDDNLINILRKYGIAGLGVGTGGAVTLREALRDSATA